MAFPSYHFKLRCALVIFYKVNRFRWTLDRGTSPDRRAPSYGADAFKTEAVLSGPTTAPAPLFIHSRTKVLSASEFHCPRPVALATNTLFPSDTKPELKNLLSG